MSSVHGKRIVVTGATGGLGPKICEALLAMGGQVVAVARRRTGLDDLRAGLKHHDRLRVAECDVTSAAGVSALFTSVETDGPVSAVVHAAGAFEFGTVVDLSDEAIERMVATNLTATTWVVRAALASMIPKRTGSVVVIAADQALSPGAGLAVYGATKAGAVHLVQGAANEARAAGVRVNAVLPGIIDTPANRTAMPDADPSAWAAPIDIARSVLWLVSDDAAGVTGSLLCVPGT